MAGVCVGVRAQVNLGGSVGYGELGEGSERKYKTLASIVGSRYEPTYRPGAYELLDQHAHLPTSAFLSVVPGASRNSRSRPVTADE